VIAETATDSVVPGDHRQSMIVATKARMGLAEPEF
jgi:hypothetical protein